MTVGAKPGTSGVAILHDPFSLGTAGRFDLTPVSAPVPWSIKAGRSLNFRLRSPESILSHIVRGLQQRLGLRLLSRTSCSVVCSKFLAPPRAVVSQLTA